jgi:phosphoribosylanthranilate isomerase
VSRTRIKICGITRPEDGLRAAEAGADAIGLVFYPSSPRAVDIDTAEKIIAALPPFVGVVGLFVDEAPQRVREVISALPLSLLQFHGDENAADCEIYGCPYIKAIRMRESVDLRQTEFNYPTASGLLLDAYTPGKKGGTGEVFDWNRIPGDMSMPVILAGGLSAENVAGAISATRPFAVDVSGGVELEPGIKCPEKILQFVSAVHKTN